MPTQIELLPDEPILVQTMGADYDYRTDMVSHMERLLAIFDQQTQPIFFIIDIREVSFSLDDLMGASAGMVKIQAQLFKHPQLRETLIITESRMIDLAARGLSSPIFGGIKMKVFGSLDDALEYARKNDALRDAI